jgi:hypothetical protein
VRAYLAEKRLNYRVDRSQKKNEIMKVEEQLEVDESVPVAEEEVQKDLR